ncbi:MFS transporter [Brevibacterium sp. 50QC2O2]|uniref:MFS transporter n=1 Tax=Brevibacterium TaxID=1696 RepID=UPI00211BE4C9|nr:MULTISPECIES: MFS transporter [unclassified Brevibacterium]MCQ9369511.1 MFS transporter [Brevibacterium sp. 91QC2O2]MCQ9386689.1 MFS transporter [Brevibacterium sp. 68QC2CO]MCQ9389357.1 MFS transporter [Brevibacterium sp. 50QC2O2]
MAKDESGRKGSLLGPYKEIFALPGALRFSLSGLLARFPIAVLGLGIVLYIQGTTGSYGMAGSVTAVFMIVQAIANPIVAKQIDRRGQAKVMVPLVVVHLVALVALMLVVPSNLWVGLTFLCAGAAGATMGSVGALVRARWAYAAQTPGQLNTAFSWEAVADEILFVSGPVIVTALATAVFPPAGLLIAMIALTIGSILFYAQKSTEPEPSPKAPTDAKGKVLSNSGIFIVVLIELFLGANFGATDVATVAFAEERGLKEISGIALGIYAGGSLISGAIYGTMVWKSQPRTRYVPLLALLCVGTWLLQFTDNLPVLCILLFVMGFTVSPSLIIGQQIIQELAPPRRLTEALAWASTSMGFGVAAGTSVAGILIDASGAHAAYLVPAVGTTVSVVLALLFNRRFDPTIRSHAARQARAQRTIVE